jgi:hypothetical protein
MLGGLRGKPLSTKIGGMAESRDAGGGVPLYPEGPRVVTEARARLLEAVDLYAKLTSITGSLPIEDAHAIIDATAVARRRVDHAAAELARTLVATGR